jgi:hypothetical protein
MSNGILGLALLGLAFGLGPRVFDDTSSGDALGSREDAAPRQASCDARKLVGVWTGARYSMQILGDMTYRASGSPNMATIDVNGTLQISACSVQIVDVSGKFACPSAAIGQYTFTVTDTTLTFSVVSDPCDGRRMPLTAGPLKKRKQ